MNEHRLLQIVHEECGPVLAARVKRRVRLEQTDPAPPPLTERALSDALVASQYDTTAAAARLGISADRLHRLLMKRALRPRPPGAERLFLR